jgi:sec-independent protein translocase protein TatB
MLGIGPEELLLVALLALLVLGPERLPQVMRDMGRVVGDLRRTSDELRSEFLNADKLLDAATAPKAAPAQPAVAPPQPAAVSSGPEGESAFDREMREARERMKGGS